MASVLLASLCIAPLIPGLGAGEAGGSPALPVPTAVSGATDSTERQAYPNDPLPPAPKLPSTSLGRVGKGSLSNGAELPAEGPGFRRIPEAADPDAFFGTDELVGLLERSAARIAEVYPGSVLQVGNLSEEGGGRTQYASTHRSGRDVDVGFYVTDRSGSPLLPDRFIRFNDEGRAYVDGKQYRFDEERNLALVESLLSATETGVQWIFIHSSLKRRLLRHARREGRPRALVRKMIKVLHRPRDASPHRDHMHVRIHCSVEDAAAGCVDEIPMRPWAPTRQRSRRDKEAARRAAELERWRAKNDLGELAEQRAGDTWRNLLRPVKVVWREKDRLGRAIAGTVAEIGRAAAEAPPPEPAPAPQRPPEPPPARRPAPAPVTTIAEKPAPPALAPRPAPAPAPPAIAASPPPAPEPPLPPVASADSIRRLTAAQKRAWVARVRAEPPSETAVPGLMELLTDGDPRVRQQAHETLREVTNQNVRGNLLAEDPRERIRVVRRWREFWAVYGEGRWLEWVGLGFEQRGFTFKGRLLSERSVPTLIEAIGHPELAVSHNAVRVLAEIAGQNVDPRARSRAENRAYWSEWWAEHGASRGRR